jgi:hypothetical protein
MPSLRKVINQMGRHGFPIVGDKDKIILLAPAQNIWV